MEQQLEMFEPARIRYTGYEPEIDWDAVSGMDLASTPRLLARWINSDRKRRDEAETRRWAREIKERNRCPKT